MTIITGTLHDVPPVQTGPGANPASCTMDPASFPGVNYGRGVPLTTLSLLVPRSWKSRAIPLSTLWAPTGPVTGTLYLFILYDDLCTCTIIYHSLLLRMKYISDKSEEEVKINLYSIALFPHL